MCQQFLLSSGLDIPQKYEASNILDNDILLNRKEMLIMKQISITINS